MNWGTRLQAGVASHATTRYNWGRSFGYGRPKHNGGPRYPPADYRIRGGDTASTGIGEHERHAEHHRLVNPMENTITADTQLALAA